MFTYNELDKAREVAQLAEGDLIERIREIEDAAKAQELLDKAVYCVSLDESLFVVTETEVCEIHKNRIFAQRSLDAEIFGWVQRIAEATRDSTERFGRFLFRLLNFEANILAYLPEDTFVYVKETIVPADYSVYAFESLEEAKAFIENSKENAAAFAKKRNITLNPSYEIVLSIKALLCNPGDEWWEVPLINKGEQGERYCIKREYRDTP